MNNLLHENLIMLHNQVQIGEFFVQGRKSDIESEQYKNEIKNRLLSKKNIDVNGCWIWFGCVNENDYGVIRAKRKNYLAHRLSFEIFNNCNPEGKFVCHSCDQPLCINPNHLFLGTQTDNMLDAKQKKRMKSGEKHYISKLSYKEVEEIRVLLNNKFSQFRIAELYGVSESNISYISSGKTWKNNSKVTHVS